MSDFNATQPARGNYRDVITDLRAQLATAKADGAREALEKYKGTGEVLAPSCGCLPGRETLWKCTHLVPFIPAAAPPESKHGAEAEVWRECTKQPITVEYRDAVPGESIETMEGTLTAKEGDVIIRGVKGEVYPCDREVFEMTYTAKHGGECPTEEPADE